MKTDRLIWRLSYHGFGYRDFQCQKYNNGGCNCDDLGALPAVPSPMVMMSFTCLKD
jgi:hypothetical protein